MPHVDHETLYEGALENFPYELTSTGATLGDYEADETGFIEFSEEYIFTAGQLFNEQIIAGGWIEIRQDRGDDQPTISGFFGLARNGDWKNGQILPETVAVLGDYDIEAETWDLRIDRY